MKILQTFLIATLLIASGCEEGYIDDISAVEPGPDESAPTVTINYPTSDVVIPFTDEETDLNFEFQAADDIEIKSISISLNGSELVTIDEFKDYRKAFENFMYESLPIGEYTLNVTAIDISDKSTTETVTFEVTNDYVPKEGETLYMPFEGQLYLDLVTETNPTVVGDPGFAGEGASGAEAYAGAADSYLTFPTEGLLNNEFSASFWYKVNAEPNRAGILVVGPPDLANPDAQNVRTSGFRLFREDAGGKQRIKLNVGNGTADTWFDGGAAADIDPAAGAWVHVAFTISDTECVVYLNGEVVKQGAFDGVDWTDCNILSIASGAPHFTGWGHLSDNSFLDDLRLFNKALTQEEVQELAGAGS